MSVRKKAKKVKLKGKQLLSRLTGLSFPAGASWKPPTDERDIAKRLLTFLEDRRALYRPYDMEVGYYVVQSVLQVRERLTKDLESVSRSSPLGESLVAMRAACRKFLDETQMPPRHIYRLEPLLLTCLGELRAIFGLHVGRLAYIYDLDVEPELATILPSDTKRAQDTKPETGPTQRGRRNRS